MKIYIKTFGCSSNRADSAAIEALLRDNHFELVPSLQDAEAVIVNTCTVRKDTERKVLHFIHDLTFKNVLVTGCMAEVQPALLAKEAPGASIVSPHSMLAIPDVLRSGVRKVVLLRGTPIEPAPFRTGVRYTIPISVGCLGACSYCVVKLVRGDLRSLSPERVSDLISCAVRGGAREILLSAQDTCAYGRDLQSDLPSLLDRISRIDGDFRVRLGMFNPSSASDTLDRLVASFTKCKMYQFIHVPVQSGSDDVLHAMNRSYTVESFKRVISAFRLCFPLVTVFTDVIVGFPGETEDDFESTFNLIKDVCPAKTHIARYSPRPHTAASSMRQVHEDVKKTRSDRLALLTEEIQLKNNSSWVGKMAEATVVGEYLRGGMIARTDEYKTVAIGRCPRSMLGSRVKVEIDSFTPYYLKGRIIRR